VVAHATVCASRPVRFDVSEIDRDLASARTLHTLAKTANKAIFDLYEHCAIVVRFFVVEGGKPRVVAVLGDRQIVHGRDSFRLRAVASGATHELTLGRPAGFRLVDVPLHDEDGVSGLLEFVIPTELVEPKQDGLSLVCRAAAASLRAWRRATDAQHEAHKAAGTGFALGLRLANTLSRAGELGAAVRSAVDFLSHELKAPVAAWRTDPTGESLRLAASTGVGNGRRAALEDAAGVIRLGSNRRYVIRDLRDRVMLALASDATIVDGGSVVFVAAGYHPELERCGRELAALLDQLPVANVSPLSWVDGDGDVREWGRDSIERARLNDLTPRELEILMLLADGGRTSQIAQRLVISEKTVKTHIQNILRKLDVGSRLEAAAIAVRAGFVPLSAS
jgi:DNA-binding CsgD family transcriptional regulator